MGSILTSMSTTSSCQPLPHHHQAMGSVTGPERVNSGLNTVSGAKANVFSGKIVGSLFPRLRAWICKSGRQKSAQDFSESSISHKNHKRNWESQTIFGRWGWQNVHETVARARFHIKILNKFEVFGALLEDEIGTINSYMHTCMHSFIQWFIIHSFLSTHSFQFHLFHFISTHFFPAHQQFL